MKFLEWYDAVSAGQPAVFTYTLPRNAVRLPQPIEDKMPFTSKIAISMCRKYGYAALDYKGGTFCVVFG